MSKQNRASGPRLDVSRYRGQWLALDPDTHEIVAHSESLQEAKAAAAKRQVVGSLMYAVPKSDGYFVGLC